MNALLDLLVIIALTALAVTGIGVVLILRAARRFRRTMRARVHALHISRYRPSRPSGGQRDVWSASASPLAVDWSTAASVGSVLSVRAWLPGHDRAVWQVRHDLHRDISATTRVLRAARQSGRPVPELEGGVAMLARQARELQLDLRLIAVEPDRKERARLLTVHAARATLIRDTCAEVRAAVLQEGSTSNEPALHRIVNDITEAVTAAHLRGRAYQDLSRL